MLMGLLLRLMGGLGSVLEVGEKSSRWLCSWRREDLRL